LSAISMTRMFCSSTTTTRAIHHILLKIGSQQISDQLKILWFHTRGIDRIHFKIVFNQIFSLSPDLNPNENVRSMIKNLVRSERPVITSKEDLLVSLESAHQKMCDSSWRQFFINLVGSMPRRLEAVRQASGGHTRY
jgi:hypothetical protein